MQAVDVAVVHLPHALVQQVVLDVVVAGLDVVVDALAHLLDDEVGRGHGELHARGQGDGAQRAVRRDRHVVRFRHGRHAPHLGQAAAVRNVRLDDVDGGRFEEAFQVPAAVEAFAERDRDRRQQGELLDALGVFGQQGLLDEERIVRLQRFRQLLRHRLVQAAVEVEPGVEAERLHRLQPFHARLEHLRGVQPVHVFRGVHLDRPEALRQPLFRRAFHVFRSVAADP